MKTCLQRVLNLTLNLIALSLYATSSRVGVPEPEPGALTNLMAQINALQAEARALPPAQKKLATQLRDLLREFRGKPPRPYAPLVASGLELPADGRFVVDITAEVSPTLLDRIRRAGGEIINSFPQYRAIRAKVPLASIDALVEEAAIHFIRPEVPCRTNAGIETSEGDVAHRANYVRNISGRGGTGVKVGVLSDSVKYLSDSIANGNLPATVEVLPGQSGVGGPYDTGEGTAMLEIIHDLAPQASLAFAAGAVSEAAMAANIIALADAGCSVIVDDIKNLAESPFHENRPVSQAVMTVSDRGVLYFSSAGNDGSMKHGTSGTWQGDFKDHGPLGHPAIMGQLHEWVPGNVWNQVTNEVFGIVDLFWTDPWLGSMNDYNLFVIASNGSDVVHQSTLVQGGTLNPPHEFTASAKKGQYIVVARGYGEDRAIHVETSPARLQFATTGNVRGHNGSSAANAFCVAAIDARNLTVAFNGGVYVTVEYFSSDGPRHIYYEADGTPVTPNNLSMSGGALLMKPDFTAATSVKTSVPFFKTFSGTSAAAPHAAAIAALLLSRPCGGSGPAIAAALRSSALDIEQSGFDANSGAGIVMADRAANVVWQILSVTNAIDGGPGSLREAIALASPCNVIELSVGQSILTNELVLTKNLTISGGWIIGSGTNRVFRIAAGATVYLYGLYIAYSATAGGADGTSSHRDGGDGEDGGGIHNSGTLLARACLFNNNSTGRGGYGYTLQGGETGPGGKGGKSGRGGSIYNAPGGVMSLATCQLSYNRTGPSGSGRSSGQGYPGGDAGNSGAGGAICNDGSALLTECTIEGNVVGDAPDAGWGGSGFLNGPPPGDGGKNGNGGGGGGIYNSGSLILDRCAVIRNYAGISFPSDGAGGSGVTQNGATGGSGGHGGHGGGILNSGLLRVTNSTIALNRAGAGSQGGRGGQGGFGLDFGVGFATAFDGGEGGRGGDGGDGGGLYNTNGGSAVLIACTFAENVAGQPGNGGKGGQGGYYGFPSPLGTGGAGGGGGNAGRGGGIFNAGSVTIWNTLVTSNRVWEIGGTGGPGGMGGNGTPPGPAGPPGTNGLPGVELNVSGALTAQGKNLIGGNAPLGPLGFFGGPTQTYFLRPDGSAVDEGDNSILDPPFNLTVDQRGYPRRQGNNVDIGAVEIQRLPVAGVKALSLAKLGNGSFSVGVNNYFTIMWVQAASTPNAANNDWQFVDWLRYDASSGSYRFTDPQATVAPGRFYRLFAW